MEDDGFEARVNASAARAVVFGLLAQMKSKGLLTDAEVADIFESALAGPEASALTEFSTAVRRRLEVMAVGISAL